MPRHCSVLHRCFAVLALLLSPGLAGSWLRLSHECPQQVPGQSSSPLEHHHAGHSAGHPECHCVGACHTASLPASPVPALASAAESLRPAEHPAPKTVRLERIPHLHPFALPPPAGS